MAAVNGTLDPNTDAADLNSTGEGTDRKQGWISFVCEFFCIRMEEGRGVTRFWWGNLRERDRWGDQDVDGRIILKWILRKWEGVVGTGWSWLRIGKGGGRL